MFQQVIEFIRNNSWFQVDELYDEEVTFITRENGDVGSETPGDKDFEEAARLKKLMATEFPLLETEIDECDEWVHFNVTIKK